MSEPNLREVLTKAGELKEILGLQQDPSEIVELLYGMSLSGPAGTIHTELSDDEIAILALLDAANENDDPDCRYDEPILKAFTRNYKIGKISKDRQSRKELVTVARKDEAEEPGIGSRLKAALTGGEKQ